MRRDTKEDLENFYNTTDPYGYVNNPDDIDRKRKIIEACGMNVYARALDIGAGEGWITKDLPAKEIEGYEISDTAAARFPSNVKRTLKPEGLYDLITVTGIMYGQFQWEDLLETIVSHASGRVVFCNIEEWEISKVLSTMRRYFRVVLDEKFKYRQYIEHLIIYENLPSAHNRVSPEE